MDKKNKPLEDVLDKYNKYKGKETSDNIDSLIGLAMITSLFGSGFGSSDYKYYDLDKRLTKLESKQEIIEKFISK